MPVEQSTTIQYSNTVDFGSGDVASSPHVLSEGGNSTFTQVGEFDCGTSTSHVAMPLHNNLLFQGETSHRLPRGAINRRDFIRLAALSGLGLIVAACGGGKSAEAKPTPTTMSPEDYWKSLSPKLKLRAFEQQTIPQIESFDADKELISAVVDYFCDRVGRDENRQRLKDNIFFLESDKFIETALEDIQRFTGREVTQEDRDNLRYAAGLSMSDGRIIVNLGKVRMQEMEVMQNPVYREQLKGKDAQIISKKSILMHELTHQIVSTEVYSFPTLIFQDPNNSNLRYFFDTMTGFKFKGFKETDKSTVYLTGMNEAMTEYIANSISQEVGIYFSGSNEISYGAAIVGTLNKEAGIEVDDFLEYYQGEKPAEEMLRRYASISQQENPDLNRTLIFFIDIGYYVNAAGWVATDYMVDLTRKFIQQPN